MAYQDRWLRGKVTDRGERACEPRYELVRAVVAEYTRPITVLDLGANIGYFGCRLAAEFGAVAVMIEGRANLVEAVAANAIPTTLALRHKLTVEDLQQLAASEHFDVVLALNVLHHFQDSLGALDAVLGLGDQVIIETPSRDDKAACGGRSHVPLLDAIARLEPELLGHAGSHVTPGAQRPIVRVRREKTSLTSGYAYRRRLNGNPSVRAHVIESTLERKTVLYASGEERPWHPGMNLWNFCQMGGIHPSREHIVAAVIEASAEEEHGDLRPWNFVLQGDGVVAIDTQHRGTHRGPEALDETIAWLRAPSLAYTARAGR